MEKDVPEERDVLAADEQLSCRTAVESVPTPSQRALYRCFAAAPAVIALFSPNFLQAALPFLGE